VERPAAVTVDVEYDERYWYPDDGGEVWLAGYQVVDPASGSYLARDAAVLRERGLRVAGVAGAARHHAAGLASDALAPGAALELRRDRRNEHDVNAIAVFPVGGDEQAGWVPREVAAELAADLDAGRPWAAIVLREQRPSPRDPRTGLTMLLARGEAIELRERGRRRG
jgi:hypothetical protein